MSIDPSKASVADVVRAAREARIAQDAAEAAAHAKPAAEEPAPVADPTPVTDPPADGEKAKPVTFKAAYVSDDGVIYLIGAYAGNVDLDEDVLQTKAMVTMAYDFCSSEKRTFKANHQEVIGADLVASMPGAPILKSGKTLAFGEEIPAGDEIIGIDLKAEPIAWFVGVRPHDPALIAKAKAGEIAGASWGAYVDRTEIKE